MGPFGFSNGSPKFNILQTRQRFFFFVFFCFFFCNFNILYDGSRGGRGWLQDSEDRSRTPKNLGVPRGILDDDYLPLLMNSNQLLASSMPATCCPLPPLPVCLCVRVCVHHRSVTDPGSSDPGDATSPTPPASPPTYRRVVSREENPNVFSRLTHGTNVGCEPMPDRGVIHPFQGKVPSSIQSFFS